MDFLTTILVVLVVVAILYEVAQRVGVPYPALIVLGGLGLALVPGLPRIALESTYARRSDARGLGPGGSRAALVASRRARTRGRAVLSLCVSPAVAAALTKDS